MDVATSVARRLPSLPELCSYGVGIRRCSCCVGTYVLPLFYEVEAPPLAVSSQPSPSKPVIPKTQCNYTTITGKPPNQRLRDLISRSMRRWASFLAMASRLS